MAVGEVQGRLNLIWNLVMGIMTAAGVRPVLDRIPQN